MHLRNSATSYGLVSIVLHWSVALLVFGLFGLGLWMVDLGYYSSWRQTAPDLHKSLGLLLFGLMLVRLMWRFFSPPPAPVNSYSNPVRRAAKVVHALLFFGLFALMLAGYLISTAEGRGISLFGWFEVPALFAAIDNQADIAGWVHEYLAWALVIFAGLHALAACKHHFVDRDSTLRRMLGRP